MVERRKSERSRFGYYMPVLDSSTLETVGHLSDISGIGFKLDCQRELPLNRDYRLRIDLTPDVANKSSMSFVARTKWCARDRFEPLVFNVGFELIDISPGDADIFRRIYEKYGMHDKRDTPF